jgi:hypothetical protein
VIEQSAAEAFETANPPKTNPSIITPRRIFDLNNLLIKLFLISAK